MNMESTLKLYQQEGWLRGQIVDQRQTPADIAKALNQSFAAIYYFVRKFGLNKMGSLNKKEGKTGSKLHNLADLEDQKLTIVLALMKMDNSLNATERISLRQKLGELRDQIKELQK
jgi:hypothetical protein